MPRILWWNCQNLFDDENDPKTKDIVRSRNEYLRDVREIAEVIDTLKPQADLLGLTEIENHDVASELCEALRWGQTHQDFACPEYIESNDVRGIDVVCLAKNDGAITVSDVSAEWPDDTAAVRPILHVFAECAGQPLEIALLHGKSRRSGPTHRNDPTPGSRIRHAYGECIRRLGEEAGKEGVGFIALGDFNDEPESYSLRQGAKAEIGRSSKPRPERLYNLTMEASPDSPGTHNHYGDWAYLDQVLVNGVLLQGGPVHIKGRPGIATHGPLLYQGKPNRWYSDHLPLWIDIEVR